MKYVYAAIFNLNDDGSYTITFPDLSGCISEGKDLFDALVWAESALYEYLEYLTDKKMDIPAASRIQDIQTESGQFVNLVRVELKSSEVA